MANANVNFFRGGTTLPSSLNTDGLYFTSDGKMYNAKVGKYIGENLGINNTNEARGCYWKSIDIPNCIIVLSSTQPVDSNHKYNASYATEVNVPSEWSVGDRISIVNNDRYDVCCIIEEIDGSKITISELPFSSLSDPVADDGLELEIDDYMILNVDKNTGPVKLNETAIVGGTGSKALGNASYSMGWECISYGKSATTFGIGTEAGFAAFATGKYNKSSGLHSFTQGLENKATQSGSSAFGRRNISGARDTFVTGENNITYASTSAVFGKDNHIDSTGVRTVVLGNMNQGIKGQNSLVGGYLNTLTGSNSILFGSTNTSSGAYGIVTGASNTLSTFKDDKGNDVTPDSMAVFGQGHTIAGKHGLVAGYLNTATGGNSVFTALGRNITIGANNTHAIGRNLTTKTTEGQVVLGKYNNVDDTGGKILVVGAGTAEKPLNVFTITSGGTGKFSNNCYANKFYEGDTALSNKYAPISHDHSAFGPGHTVTGTNGFTIGQLNEIIGQEGFAAGNNNTVNLKTTFALGYQLTTAAATSKAWGQVVIGKYNLQDNESLFVVGGGSSSAKSNLFTVSSSGVKSSVDIYENGTSLTAKYAPKYHEHKFTEVSLWDCARYDMQENDALYVVKFYDNENNVSIEKIVSYLPKPFFAGTEDPDETLADAGVDYFLNGISMPNAGNQTVEMVQYFYKVHLVGNYTGDSDSWRWEVSKVSRMKLTFIREEEDVPYSPTVEWRNNTDLGLFDFNIYKYE